MSSIGVKRKLKSSHESFGDDVMQNREGGRGRGEGRSSTVTGRGGQSRRGGRGDGSSRQARGRGGRGRGRGRGGAHDSSRFRSGRAMDHQLGREAAPPESLHKYVRGPGNSFEVSKFSPFSKSELHPAAFLKSNCEDLGYLLSFADT